MKLRKSSLVFALLLGAQYASASVIVNVNGDPITSEEINKVLQEGTQGRFDSLPSDKKNELRQRIIDGLIAQELVYDDAKKIGILESKEFKNQFDGIVKRLRTQLAAKLWEQKQLESIRVNQKDIKDYFDKNNDEFVDKEKVRARHILVKSESEANDIIRNLSGLSGDKLRAEFIAQAKLRSIGPSATKGGDLGYFTRGQMVPSFNDAAFSMREGAISGAPVQTQFGYHVIYIEDRKPAKKLSFDEVKNFIEQRLRMEKFKSQMEQKMSSLREKAKITYSK